MGRGQNGKREKHYKGERRKGGGVDQTVKRRKWKGVKWGLEEEIILKMRGVSKGEGLLSTKLLQLVFSVKSTSFVDDKLKSF